MDVKRDIKVIVVDLDGTLLNDDHKVSDRNKTVIKKAIDKGIQVVIATGKTRASAAPILEELGLNTPGVFVQGLMICNADGSVRSQQMLDNDAARHAIQYAESNGFEVIAYSGNQLVCKNMEDSIEKIAEFGEPMPEPIGPLVNHIGKIDMHKLIIVGGSARKLQALRWQLNQQIGTHVGFTDGGVLTSLEILPKNTSKGRGVKTLLGQMNVNSEHVMGIGDAENDVSLMEVVGFGVAVENAAEATKAAADEVVSSNNDSGVAEAIERFVLLDEKPAETETSTDDTSTTEEPKAESDTTPNDTSATESNDSNSSEDD
ncbi:MAG: HAD family hydrolase [Chloroflexota bacterium]